MGLFGSVGKFVSQAVHNPVVQVLFPVTTLASLGAVSAGERYIGSVTGQGAERQPGQGNPQIEASRNTFSIYPGEQPAYYPANPSYSVYFQPDQYALGGGNPWDSSTSLTLSPVTDSVPRSSISDRQPWEDLLRI